MKYKLATSCFVIGALLTPYAAHAEDAGADRKGSATFVKDSVITAKVKAKLAAEKMSSLAQVKVDTDNKGAVVLSGKVGSQQEADKAVAIAKQTDGVKSVTSHLQISRKDDQPQGAAGVSGESRERQDMKGQPAPGNMGEPQKSGSDAPKSGY